MGNNIINVIFNPENMISSKEMYEISRNQLKILRKLFLARKYNEAPGPECLTDDVIENHHLIDSRLKKGKVYKKNDEHLIRCDRCRIRQYYLLGEIGKKMIGL